MALFKAVVWAIIILTKLRFPPGISIATILKDRCISISEKLEANGLYFHTPLVLSDITSESASGTCS